MARFLSQRVQAGSGLVRRLGAGHDPGHQLLMGIMDSRQLLQHIVVVLDEAQDPVNIGMVVRTMKNMGLSRLRLVRPGGFDPYRITGIAHTGTDVVESAERFERLDDALVGAGLVVGTTARGRRVRRNYVRPRDAAAEILEVAQSGDDIAVIFGREDRGLSNEELDLCNRVIVVPTDPEHSSLNLGQAVLVIAYEIFLAAEGAPPFKRPRRATARADRAELESLFTEVEASLHAIDFFKAQNVKPLMRTVREAAARADLDERETALFKAMAYEVRNFLARQGLERGG